MRHALTASVLLFFTTTALAAVPYDASGMLWLLIQIVIVGLICWAAWWFVSFVGLPEPFSKVAQVLIGLFAFIFVIYTLMGMLGSGPPHFR